MPYTTRLGAKSAYSVCGLVWARTEETISGTIAVQNSKRPSKRVWEGPSHCPKYSKLCYDQFGRWLGASNPPHLFTGRLPPSYWADLGRCCCSSLAPVFPEETHLVFPTEQIIFLLENGHCIAFASSQHLLVWTAVSSLLMHTLHSMIICICHNGESYFLTSKKFSNIREN